MAKNLKFLLESKSGWPGNVHVPSTKGSSTAFAVASSSPEKDPSGLLPSQPGAKLDQGKVDVLRGAIQYFPRALLAVALVSEIGARKYSWKGWEMVPDGVQRYGAALSRHLMATDEFDADTGCRHAAQVAWNALARLELILKEAEANGIQNQSDSEATSI